ncbi:hypothetical protein ACVWZK_002929 [Bradyrhizobium sp. GM0.4]
MAGRRPADWRFPTQKQQRIEDTAKKIADAQRQREGRTDQDAWWDAVLRDPRAETTRPSPARTLGGIRSELLRVECLRCFRTWRSSAWMRSVSTAPTRCGRRSAIGC